MDLIKSGEIFNLKAYRSPGLQNRQVQRTVKPNRSRFDELFLASPRAKLVLENMEKSFSSTSKPAQDKAENSVINMSEFFKGGLITTQKTPNTEFRVPQGAALPESVPVDSGVHDVNGSTSENTTLKEGSTKAKGLLQRSLTDCPKTKDLDIVPESPQEPTVNEKAHYTPGDDDDNNSAADNHNETTHKETSSPEKEKEMMTPNQPWTKPEKNHTFQDWEVKVINSENHQGIIVEGWREQDPPGDRWHSSIIVKRIHARCVQTKNKSKYNLEGPINEDRCLDQGLSKSFVKAFKNGFPSNWLELVAEHFLSQAGSEASTEEYIPKRKAAQKKSRPSKNDSTPKARESSSTRKSKLKSLKVTPKDQMRRPVEVELKTSSSGRVIKPPLAWWRGQRILTDAHHNLLGIDRGRQEHTPLSSSTINRDLKLPQSEAKASDSESNRDEKSHTPRRSDSKAKTSDSESNQDEKSHRRSDTKAKASDSESNQDEKSHRRSDSKASEDSKYEKKPLKRTRKKVPQTELLETGKKGMSASGSKIKQSNPGKAAMKRRSISIISSDSESTSSNAETALVPQSARLSRIARDALLPLSHKMSPSDEDKAVRTTRSETDNQEQLRNASEKSAELNKKKVPVGRSTRQTWLKMVTAANENDLGVQLSETGSQETEGDSPSQATYLTRQTRSRSKKGKSAVGSQFDKEQSESDSQGSSKSSEVLVASVTRSNRQYTHISSKNQLVKNVSLESTEDARARAVEQSKAKDDAFADNTTSKMARKRGRPPKTRTRNSYKSTENSREQLPSHKLNDFDDGTENNEEIIKVARKRGGPPKTQTRNSYKSPENSREQLPSHNPYDFDDGTWNKEEIMSLDKAMRIISPTTPMFWQKVSRAVRSRTAEECQLQHQAQLNLTRKKKPRPKKIPKKAAEKVKPKLQLKTLAGGVGTIKRKRELRQFMEQQDEGYEDDIFDTTPFKKTRQVRLTLADSDNVEDDHQEDYDGEQEEDDDDDFEKAGVESKTPSSRTPSNRCRPLGPPSDSSTPSSEFISPSLLHVVNRKDIDQYIYKMQQGKRGAQQHKKQEKQVQGVRTSTPKKHVSRGQASAVQYGMFEVQSIERDEDSEEEQDNYWSDEDP